MVFQETSLLTIEAEEIPTYSPFFSHQVKVGFFGFIVPLKFCTEPFFTASPFSVIVFCGKFNLL